MLYAMADNNIDIPAKRDGAIYNTFSGNQDYVISGIGQQFEIKTTSSSFLITLGTGEGLCGGRHITEVVENDSNSMIQVEANSNGYIVLRLDLTKPSGSEAYLCATPTIVRQDINNNGTIRDLPLYSYVSDDSGISSFVDMRSIKSSVLPSKVSELSNDSGYQTASQVNTLIANGIKSTVKTYTLAVASWSSSATYTITDSLITASSNQEVLPGLNITAAQLEAFQKANIQDGGQSNGSMVLKYYGTKPTVAIPIRVIYRGTK